MSENHYKTLGVAPTAELETIKQAYRQQIRQYHPDTFASRRSAIQRSGDTLRLRAIEKEIETAKLLTQRFNTAYAILSDSEARAKYDQQLAKERQTQQDSQVYRQRMRNSDEGRRTVKSRPHRPPKTASENAPFLLGFVTFIFLVIASAFLTNTVFRQEQSVITVNPSRPARAGEITMNDMQATTSSNHATQIARATIVALPTQTPRSAAENEELGDNLMRRRQYLLAIEKYSAALLVLEDSRLYAKRGLAYSVANFALQNNYATLAHDDFERALELDAANALAYRGQAWLYYQVWQSSKSPLDAEVARSAFAAYLQIAETDTEAAEVTRTFFTEYLQIAETDPEIEAALLELGD